MFDHRNKMTRFSGITILTLFIMLFIALAGTVSARPYMYNRQAMHSLDQDSSIDGPGFFSGDIVQIDGDVNGTTFAAGDQIQINGDINGSLFVAGETVQINGTVYGNIYGVAQRIQMNGQNNGDVFLAGQTTTIDSGAQVGRDLFLAGLNVRLNGDVPRHFYGAGQYVDVNATIAGNAIIDAEEVTLSDSAVIQGDLEYRSPEEADLSPNATVAGQTDYTQRDTWDMRGTMQWNLTGQQRWTARVLFALWSFLSALVVWLGIRLLKPHFWLKNTLPLSTQPLKSMGFGLLALIATPFVIILLMVTIIGIPMGIILALLYGIALYISKIIVGLFIGTLLLKNVEIENFGKEFLLVLLGLFILELLMLIPYLGWIIGFIIAIAGLGPCCSPVVSQKNRRPRNIDLKAIE